jgi:hypothetical protein
VTTHRDDAALVTALLELEYTRALHRIIPRPEVRHPTRREARLAIVIAKAEASEAMLCGPREGAA